MSSIDSFYSNALVGLTSSQQALSIISNNISNAATPGYTRELPTNVPIGGVSTDYNLIAQRQTSTYVNASVMSAQASSSANASYYTQVSQLSQVLASSTTDIGNSMQTFFTSVQHVAADPAAIPPRQQLLNDSQSVVNAFQGVGGQLAQMSDTVNAQISGDVTAINSLSAQIAKQNAAISLAEAGGNGTKPNDLLDQRDQTLQSLSKLVAVSTVSQSDGSLNVFIGNGQSLVVGGAAQTLKAVPSATDSSQMHVAYASGTNGTPVQLADSAITGGDLGATLQFRTDSLDPASRNLAQLATTFAGAVNNQHALGVDLSGTTGGTVFNLPPMSVQAASTNTGGAVLTATVGTPSAIQATDYQLSFDGTNYTLKSLQDPNTGVTLNSPATVYTGTSLPPAAQFGINFGLGGSGAMAAGDSFTVKPYQTTLTGITLAISDPSKIAAASQFSITPGSTVGSNTTMNVTGINASGVTSGQFPASVSFAAGGAYTITPAAGSGAAAVTGTLTVTNGVPQPISFNGLTLSLTATPASGNTFTLGQNQGGGAAAGSGLTSAGNNENASALAALQTLGLVSTGTGTSFSLSAQYSRVVADVGSQASVAKATSASADGVLSNLQAQQQSISGVNLDEEGANLLKYQQQYQAAAKVMQVASTLFQALLQI